MSNAIDENNDIATMINIFTVEPKKQEKLIEMFEVVTEQIMNKQEGFISANIHKSLDGTKVVNYAQWKSREAFEKMLNNPKMQIHMNDLLTVAKSIDGNLYDVVFTEKKI
jgi:heme-degrading monooxygenase HmoA